MAAVLGDVPLLIVGHVAAQIFRFDASRLGRVAHQIVGEPLAKLKSEGLKRVLFFDVRQQIERKFGLELLHRGALEVVSRHQNASGMFAAHIGADFCGGIDRC